jgi:glucose-1-phosphate thymidylyltransferase
MKGLILAGGAGTRLRPLTYTGAKQLVPVANRPILFYVVDNLVDARIHDIGVIISPETGAEVRAALDHENARGRWGASFTYLLQEKPLGLAHAVLTAKGYLGASDFCMFLGDNLIGTKITGAVQTFHTAPDFAASVMLKQVPNPSSFGVAEVDEHGNVTRLVEKPKEPRSDLALVGIYLFRPSIFDAIDRIKPSPRGELEITDAISALLDMNLKVRFERVTSWWLDTGKKDDLLLANDTVLDDWLVHELRGEVDAESKISGRVFLGEGARVERSVLRGPITIGPRTLIRDARIGPFTSIGADCVVVRSSVDHSVLMDGSRIEDVRRLEDSLIGRRVIVHPGSTHYGALSLLVGDDCRIELALNG